MSLQSMTDYFAGQRPAIVGEVVAERRISAPALQPRQRHEPEDPLDAACAAFLEARRGAHTSLRTCIAAAFDAAAFADLSGLVRAAGTGRRGRRKRRQRARIIGDGLAAIARKAA